MDQTAPINNNKVAIISGASRGLGAITSAKLNTLNWNLGLCARTHPGIDGGNVLAKIVDVSYEHEVKQFVEDVYRKFGRIDALVNDAGFRHPMMYLEQMSKQIFQRSFNVNVLGPFYFMREVIPIMRKQNSGIIINVSSNAGINPNSKLPAYSASKAALISLTKAVEKELSETNIKCTFITPGAMNTRMRQEVVGDAELHESPDRIADEIVEMIVGELNDL